MNLTVKWPNILDASCGKAIKLSVQKAHSGKHQIISAAKDSSRSEKVVYGRSELNYYADTTVEGVNLCILRYTGK